MIEIAIDAVNKRVPVIAGTGSNSTAEAIRLTRHAYKAGADGALIVAPYYNRPTQEGLYQHYKAVAEAVPIPIIVYNIPGRTGVNINPDTLARLARIKNIVGVKEASGSIKQMSDVIGLCGRILPCCPVMISSRCRSWRWAGMGSSRLFPMWRRRTWRAWWTPLPQGI